MKRCICLVFMIYIGTGILLSQYRYDHNAVLGYWSDIGPEYFDPILKFGENGVRIEYKNLPIGMDLGCNSMSNSAGDLQFYINGCDMANHRHEIMDNGTGFNPGFLADLNCHTNLGYASLPQSIISLPMPGAEDMYMVVHELDDLLRLPNSLTVVTKMRYSIVDMSANGGAGRVISKNVEINQDSFSRSGSLSAVKHANEEDWWIIKPGYFRDGSYCVLHMSKEGIKKRGTHFVRTGRRVSTFGASFSPNGRKYVANNVDEGIDIFDFDRETGVLYNHQFLPTLKHNSFSNGVTFSPNSRFIYVATGLYLCQVDLEESPLRLDTVAVWDGTVGNELGQRTFFGPMMSGPDCRVYISTGYGLPHMHVIMQPDEKGAACDVRQNHIVFDTPIRGLPYFPNYRLDTPYPYCNPDMDIKTSVSEEIGIETKKKQLLVFPSPATEEVTVRAPERLSSVALWDISGQKVYSHSEDMDTYHTVDISRMRPGTYIVRAISRSGEAYSHKFLKIE